MINPTMNHRRVRSARKALAVSRPELARSKDAVAVQEGIEGLLADLLHLANVRGLDFQAIAKKALKQARLDAQKEALAD